MENLLLGAENEFAVTDGYSERGTEERRLQMGMTVAVMPCFLVAVIAARRNEFVQNRGQIVLQTRFKLDGADRCRAADVENVDSAETNARVGHDGRDLRGEIVHITGAFAGDRNLLLTRHVSMIPLFCTARIELPRRL